jgi:predicted ATPase/class 3 adenylate cyclase/Tfp pilus assembly protein PilF
MPVFFLSDIEKSTLKWEQHADVMGQCLIRHDAILTETIGRHGGRVVKHTGDGFFAVFDPGDPLSCVIEIQKRLAREDWGPIGDLRVRVALNAGEAEQRGEDYFGPAINRTARLLAAAWGGQILLSAAAKSRCNMPEGADLIDLGIHFLPDLGDPVNIYQLVHPDLPIRDFPGLRTLSGRPHNLPSQPTEFIGREKELEEISAWLREPARRLINIVGPGGIGKTRLALQAGAASFDRFDHGVFFIPLENLTIGSIQFLVFTIAEALNFTFYSREDPRLQLINYLREKQMLLILDNFEHLVGEAELLSEIMSQGPKVKLLVTSRERLRLKGEHVYELAGLEYPARADDPDFDRYGAVRLFVQAGRSVQPNLSLTAEDRESLLSIFRLVAGVPLCIELAASWMRTVTCSEIVQELEKSMDFLDRAVQDLPKRHRNLRAVFEYSWVLLTEREKAVFRKMAVFSAAFTRDAAEKISGIGLADIAAMVDKSLLRRRPDGRYEMFPLLRQYAEEKFAQDPGEYKSSKDRHAVYYALRFKEFEDQYYRDYEDTFLKSLAEDADNGRQALTWSTEQELFPEAKNLLNAFYVYYEMKGWFLEAERLMAGIQDKLEVKYGAEPAGEPRRSFYVMVLRLRGAMLRNLSRYDEARSGLEKAQRLSSGSEAGDAVNILAELGTIAYRTGDYDRARELYEKASKHWKDAGNARKIALILNNLGNIFFDTQIFDRALELYEKSLKIRRELGDKRGIASTLNNLGSVYFSLDKLDQAEYYHRQSIEIRQAINDRYGLSTCYNNLGLVLGNLGKYEEAIEYYTLGLAIKREIGDTWGVCNTLVNIGSVYGDIKKFAEARDCFREALRILSRINAQPLMIHTLNRCAEFFMAEDKKSLALEIFTFIAGFPVVGEKRRSNVKKTISEFPAAEAEIAAKKVADLSLDEVVEKVKNNL